MLNLKMGVRHAILVFVALFLYAKNPTMDDFGRFFGAAIFSRIELDPSEKSLNPRMLGKLVSSASNRENFGLFSIYWVDSSLLIDHSILGLERFGLPDRLEYIGIAGNFFSISDTFPNSRTVVSTPFEKRLPPSINIEGSRAEPYILPQPQPQPQPSMGNRADMSCFQRGCTPSELRQALRDH